MEDARRREKSSASTSAIAVVRQFAGSRIEREVVTVVTQVFDVVWDSSSHPTPHCSSHESHLDDPLRADTGATTMINESRIAGGVV
jgi:hypothetical protein